MTERGDGGTERTESDRKKGEGRKRQREEEIGRYGGGGRGHREIGGGKKKREEGVGKYWGGEGQRNRGGKGEDLPLLNLTES